jgi:uncharacterized protein YciI
MSDPERLFLLFYDYVPDILERRAPHRDAHLEHARLWCEEGRLVLAGALGDPPYGAAIVLRVSGTEEVSEFVRDDPYDHAGLVTDWRVEPWSVVVS